jgi:thyroxine 5-deiodinase
MNALSAFAALCRDFQERASFVIVYLEEAHPTDGWMYGSVKHSIAQHTSAVERHAAAAVMQAALEEICAGVGAGVKSEAGVPSPALVVDSMDNLASTAFGALPERLAILVAGKLVFLGGKGPEDYSVEACRKALCAVLD